MDENHEQEALNAYLKLLRNKGASIEVLKLREDFIRDLMPMLLGQSKDGRLYRDIVENLLDTMDKTQWSFYLPVAREFFPFWTRDIKAIAALNAESGFDLESTWQPLDCDLQTLWNVLDKEKFEVGEAWPLKSYTLALRLEGAAQILVDTRVKLVKLLLVRLRDAPEKNHKIYRIAVDSTMPLFTLKEMRQLFQIVVREFFYFWIGDPDATQYILTKKIRSELKDSL